MITAMRTYQILLLDKVEQTIEKIENFKGEEADVKARLLELQLGYCEGEKPTVTEQIVKDRGKHIRTLIAESDCDFSYITPVAIVLLTSQN